MKILLGIVLVVIIFFVLRSVSKRSRKRSREREKESQEAHASEELRIFNENLGWLKERWTRINEEQEAGQLRTVKDWFFDEVTDSQLQRIKSLGLEITGGPLSKGQASDIIGLYEPVEEKNEEILQFFKIPIKGMNQSKARDEVGKIFLDPEKAELWNNRPVSPWQKEYYKFFEVKTPKGLIHQEAERFIREHSSTLSESDEKKYEEWEAYEQIYEELNDPDFRENYSLKKVSLSLLRDAISELGKDGHAISELAEDIDLVVDKVIELKPEIEKT